MYHRLTNPSKLRSFFLFGARATGKTELLRQCFSDKDALFIDLLDPELANKLSAYPNELLALIKPHQGKKNGLLLMKYKRFQVYLI
jgi:hypothetical protein